MSGMAEVLELHTPVDATTDGVPEDEIWCNNIECGFTMKRTIEYEDVRDFATHQVAALSAAGFGPVKEAWDEGYTTGNAHNGRRDANPYLAAAVRGES